MKQVPFRPPPCTRCGSTTRVLSKDERLVFYTCDSCGANGAVSIRSPTKTVNRHFG